MIPRAQDHEPPATPKALLQLMQLASPALPVGGFSYSEGLEAAVEAGLVSNEVQAGDWLLDQLGLSLARADLPVLAQAVPAWQAHDMARIRALNDNFRVLGEGNGSILLTQGIQARGELMIIRIIAASVDWSGCIRIDSAKYR